MRRSVAARGARAAKRFGVKLWTSGGGFDGRVWQMPISEKTRSVEAIHRKLRAVSAVFLDPAATEHEKANAKGLKGRLERQLSQEATPEGAWTDIMFRLGRGVKEMTSRPLQRAIGQIMPSDLAECSVEVSRDSGQHTSCSRARRRYRRGTFRGSLQWVQCPIFIGY
jgi:hypothetical protein